MRETSAAYRQGETWGEALRVGKAGFEAPLGGGVVIPSYIFLYSSRDILIKTVRLIFEIRSFVGSRNQGRGLACNGLPWFVNGEYSM